MKLFGGTTIRAARPAVWAALHDVDILAACVPGCLSLTRMSASRFALVVEVRAGPLSTCLAGNVEVTERCAPRLLCLKAEGGATPLVDLAGSTRIRLTPCAAGCRVTFEVDVETSRLLTALGRPILAAAARKRIDHFTKTFATLTERTSALQPVQPARTADLISAAISTSE